MNVVKITPSPRQYDRLVADLSVLRRAGAPSNTAAICDAVHEAANRPYPVGTNKRPGSADDAPGPTPGGQS